MKPECPRCPVNWRKVPLGLAMAAAMAASLPSVVSGQTVRQSTERRALVVAPLEAAVDVTAAPERSMDGEPLAERDLALALDQLSRGQRAMAQRQIEILVARYPETAAAQRARQVLAGLYSGVEARQPAASPAPPRVAAQAPALPRSQPPVPAAPADATKMDGPPRPVLSAGAFRTLQDELRFVAGDRFFFADGAADLGAQARVVIDAQARWLKRYPTLTVLIEGHGDETAGPADAARLSLERSAAVQARLIAAGVEPERIAIRGFGDRNRIALCTDAICHAQNRRAVITIVGVREAVSGGVGGADRRQLGNGVGPDGSARMPPR